MDAYIGDRKLQKGDVVKDFRGFEWIYYRVSQDWSPGKSGKVLVGDENRPQREFYPSVFDAEIR